MEAEALAVPPRRIGSPMKLNMWRWIDIGCDVLRLLGRLAVGALNVLAFLWTGACFVLAAIGAFVALASMESGGGANSSPDAVNLHPDD